MSQSNVKAAATDKEVILRRAAKAKITKYANHELFRPMPMGIFGMVIDDGKKILQVIANKRAEVRNESYAASINTIRARINESLMEDNINMVLASYFFRGRPIDNI